MSQSPQPDGTYCRQLCLAQPIQHAQRARVHGHSLPQVLCAFQLLLEESGGSLSDVYGDALDLSGALTPMLGMAASSAQDAQPSMMRRGILAGVEVMVPYVTRAIGVAFPVNELDGSVTVPFGLGANQGFSLRQTALLAEGLKEFDIAYEGEDAPTDSDSKPSEH